MWRTGRASAGLTRLSRPPHNSVGVVLFSPQAGSYTTLLILHHFNLCHLCRAVSRAKADTLQAKKWFHVLGLSRHGRFVPGNVSLKGYIPVHTDYGKIYIWHPWKTLPGCGSSCDGITADGLLLFMYTVLEHKSPPCFKWRLFVRQGQPLSGTVTLTTDTGSAWAIIRSLNTPQWMLCLAHDSQGPARLEPLGAFVCSWQRLRRLLAGG